MKALLQRVLSASVSVNGVDPVSIGPGLLIFLGVAEKDDQATIEKLTKKILNLRVFDGKNSKFDKSLIDINGEVLVVSQFTLFAETKKGRRPSFLGAARPEIAAPLFERFCKKLEDLGVSKVVKGTFGARMIVDAKNHGPFSIAIDTND